MQILDVDQRMDDDRFDRICDAGIELLESTKALLEKHGLSPDDLMGMLTVAVSGACTAEHVTPADFALGVDLTSNMWVAEAGGAATFDPPHKRNDFEMSPLTDAQN